MTPDPVSYSTDLTGRLAVVTGAARGIGRASAVALARAGADVIGIDIAGPVSPIMEVAPATVDDLAATGRQVVAVGRTRESHTFDQRDLDQVRKVATQGQHGTKFGASYSASRWGLLGLMKSGPLRTVDRGGQWFPLG